MGYEWVPLDGGVFLMGDSFEFENEDALPVHEVEIAPFEMARYETTFEQYDWFAKRTGRELPVPEEPLRGNRAVGNVSWDNAVAFCETIGGRLPTEQEWEYAAAGGSAKQLFPGTNDPDDVDRFIRYMENSIARSFPVGTKEPNLFGLYDMGGNVAEWVNEYYAYYPEPGQEPEWQDMEVFSMRLARGGSYASSLVLTQTFWRAGTVRRVETGSVGFRCARDRD